MAKAYFAHQKNRRGHTWLAALAVLIVLILSAVIVLRLTYLNDLKPVSASTQTMNFNVTTNEDARQIANDLKDSGLIKSASAFETYVRTSGKHNKLQAGTYVLSPSMSVQQIVNKMVAGDVAKNLLTILPGKRLDQIRQVFAANGYSSDQINQAFDPATYAGDPALASLPAGASLEGYLYPDSYQKTNGTPASVIVKEAIDETGKRLTANVKSGFAAQGLTTFEGLTLSSIVYQETDDASAEPTVAQVFLTRLANNMKLQSNVTANYAADTQGVARGISINSPYNTYLVQGLPPGPIGNVTDKVLNAVAHPSNTNYLYFIAGDDGKMHFAQTPAQQDENIRQYCQQKCAQP